jgi:hypothetical protein
MPRLFGCTRARFPCISDPLSWIRLCVMQILGCLFLHNGCSRCVDAYGLYEHLSEYQVQDLVHTWECNVREVFHRDDSACQKIDHTIMRRCWFYFY